jgi:Zn-dependent peptidase ImmA (M78 family)
MANVSVEEISIDVHNFRKKVDLSDVESINCKNLLWKLNVHTIYRPLSDSFSGMCLKTGDKNFMMINSNNPRGRQHFTIAHEFYHLYVQNEFKPHVCNPGYSQSKDVNEKKADLFASELLLPEMGLKKMIPFPELTRKEISIPTLLKMEQYFSVSHLAMLNRLKFLKFITAEQREKLGLLQIKKTAQEYGFGLDLYESGNQGLIISDYGSRAKELFINLRISESHYYELMNDIGIDPTLNTNE